MRQTEDKELTRLICASDYAAFEEMHRRYWPKLQKTACQKTGDRQDAHDLLQDMFIELWEKREVLKFGNELNGWLHKRLWFKLSTYFRTKDFHEKQLENFRHHSENEGAAADFDPMERREINACYESLLAAINKTTEEMPDRMRKIFLLKQNGQYSVNEIAERLNLSPKTVKNQLERAIVRLRTFTQTHNFIAVIYLILSSLSDN